MAGTGGKNRGSDAREERGVSPIVGLVLLIGMVIAATALLLLIGSPMLDAFESESERERAHLCMDETDHQLATVATTGEQRSMPSTDISDCQIDVANEGQIQFVWYNDSEADDIPWDDEDRTASAKLGALEFELEDRTIAHQGGAIWEDTGSETRIVSAPEIGYENESVQFGLMLLDQDEMTGSDPIARADHERSDELAADIAMAASNSDGTNVAIRIQSSYADGWRQHLESEFEDNASIETPSSDVVTAKISDIRDPAEPAEFVVVEDQGLKDKHGNSLDQRVHADPTNAPYRVGTIVKNTGEVTDSRNVIVSIWDEELDEQVLSKEENIKLDPGETVDLGHQGGNGHIQFQQNNEFDDELKKGETYAYTLEIEIDEDTIENELDEPGTFYYGTSEPFFGLSNVSPSTGPLFATGNITISGDVQQLGIDDTTDSSAELELEYIAEDHDTPEAYENIESITVNGTSGATTPVAWTLNASSMLQGEHKYTITTDNETESGRFVVESGVDPGDTELYLEPGNTVNISVLGTEISAEGPKWNCGRFGCGNVERNGEIGYQQVYEKYWSPVTVDVVTRPVDDDGNLGERNVTRPDDWGTDGTSGDDSPESRNLNTHDTRDEIWKHSFTTDERVSLTLGVTLHSCSSRFSSGYQLQDSDTYTDGEYYDHDDTWSEYNGNGYWDHYDCMDTYGESFNVDATTGSNNANVRVRDSENNVVPELRAGHQRQHSADEVLERGDRDLFGGELEDGNGYLDLEEGQEFVFMFEVTDEAPSDMDPDEYWEQAKETDTPGDPNFNDVIVLVEVDGMPTDIGTPEPINSSSEMVDTDLGRSNDDTSDGAGNNSDTGVEVDTDHIVIG